MGNRVLVVENDPEMAALLRRALADDGHTVSAARARDAVKLTRAQRPEVVLLDWPEHPKDGRELCVALRKSGLPGLIVTAVRPSRECLRTIFESGADDVVRKPFDLDELLLRVSALARRAHTAAHGEDRLAIGAIVIEHGQALVDGRAAQLTPRELSMLTHLARRADRAVPSAELAFLVWGRSAPASNAVVGHVNHLRSKLGRAGTQLRTVRGVGYLLASREGGHARADERHVD